MLATFALVVASSALYQVIDTGIVTGPTGFCSSMNDNGEIVGILDLDVESAGFYWKDGKIKLYQSPYGGVVWFKDINNAGVAVGTMYKDYWIDDTSFTFTVKGGIKEFSDELFEASAISESGLISGRYVGPNAAIYAPNGTRTLLNTTDVGQFTVGDINDAGDVVVLSTRLFTRLDTPFSSGDPHPESLVFRVRQRRPPLMLSTILGDGGNSGGHMETSGGSINKQGWICGTIEKYNKPGFPSVIRTAAIWLPNNSRIEAGYHCVFNDINDSCVAVGVQNPTSWPPINRQAQVWDRRYGIRDLNTLVPEGTPKLESALQINNLGEILCKGTDTDEGTRWYLLKPVKRRNGEAGG